MLIFLFWLLCFSVNRNRAQQSLNVSFLSFGLSGRRECDGHEKTITLQCISPENLKTNCLCGILLENPTNGIFWPNALNNHQIFTLMGNNLKQKILEWFAESLCFEFSKRFSKDPNTRPGASPAFIAGGQKASTGTTIVNAVKSFVAKPHS